MTANEMKQGKFTMKGKKDAQEQAPFDEKKTTTTTDADDSSVSSEGGNKTFFGFEKKKPRAEYRAEIEELKYQLEQANSDLRRTNSLQDWSKYRKSLHFIVMACNLIMIDFWILLDLYRPRMKNGVYLASKQNTSIRVIELT